MFGSRNISGGTLTIKQKFKITKGQTEIVESEDRKDHGIQNETKSNIVKTTLLFKQLKLELHEPLKKRSKGSRKLCNKCTNNVTRRVTAHIPYKKERLPQGCIKVSNNRKNGRTILLYVAEGCSNFILQYFLFIKCAASLQELLRLELAAMFDSWLIMINTKYFRQ